jgi:hypothetical protein
VMGTAGADASGTTDLLLSRLQLEWSICRVLT